MAEARPAGERISSRLHMPAPTKQKYRKIKQ
jgi:hypothetical protein